MYKKYIFISILSVVFVVGVVYKYFEVKKVHKDAPECAVFIYKSRKFYGISIAPSQNSP